MYPIGSGIVPPKMFIGGGLTRNGLVISSCLSIHCSAFVTLSLGFNGLFASVGSPEGPLPVKPNGLFDPLATLPAVCPPRLPKREAGFIQGSCQLIRLLFH